ncbi:endonuclease domain-containing protein [Cryomorphaceae bacterium 1068]|nr:endonuclease domain-containing protein [Cryomorphaceae bacterium 1068]
MSDHNFYNKHLRNFAHENRNAMTKAEACLWKYALSKRQMVGAGFRRQRAIKNYIVDFICLELKLVIEVDGYTHLLDEVQIRDDRKQKELENLGYTVLRFNDEEVLNDMNLVREVIERQIEALRKET